MATTDQGRSTPTTNHTVVVHPQDGDQLVDNQMWRLSWRADPATRAIADRHYNRQTIGHPQFVPPGRCLVLRSDDDQAAWVTSWPRFAQHAWAGAWINTMFRREGGQHLASTMIRAAVAATRARWADVPELGMVTFVDPRQVEHKRQPGRCYLKAGFRLVGTTQGGLLAFQMLLADMPDPISALPAHGTLWAAS